MNTAHLVKKAQQRLFFLRKLKRAGLSPQLPDKLLQGHNRRASSVSVQQCGMAASCHCTRPKGLSPCENSTGDCGKSSSRPGLNIRWPDAEEGPTYSQLTLPTWEMDCLYRFASIWKTSQFPHLFTGGTPGSANKGTSRDTTPHPGGAEEETPGLQGQGAKLKAELAENRRRYKPSIPSIIMGNVNSLPNKIDELSALNNQRIYRESSLFIFTETWLNHLVPDANVDLLGFTAVRARQRH
ncbi:hypothetical protein L3Q82_013466 [Scortum barcoo]|uniref:Uncharacterized protein n=1 Tax=Scortum barcoo TaxID=214431 RepID=A0ACB8W0V3_9TELE|nr:hypothetical protein L3Q82_013466 [Scortum barcoo]